MAEKRDKHGPFSLTTSDITALAWVTVGVVLITVLLVWILF